MKHCSWLMLSACTLLFFMQSCQLPEVKKMADPNAPMLFLDANVAAEMSKQYANDIGALSKGVPDEKNPYSKSMWISIDSLQKYIDKINAACKKNKFDSLTKGIRIYMAKYPDETKGVPSLETINPILGGKYTIFMVPTYNNGKIDVDFNPSSPEYSKSGKRYPLPYFEYFRKQPEKSYTETKGSTKMGYYFVEGESFIENHIRRPPPPPDPAFSESHPL